MSTTDSEFSQPDREEWEDWGDAGDADADPVKSLFCDKMFATAEEALAFDAEKYGFDLRRYRQQVPCARQFRNCMASVVQAAMQLEAATRELALTLGSCRSTWTTSKRYRSSTTCGRRQRRDDTLPSQLQPAHSPGLRTSTCNPLCRTTACCSTTLTLKQAQGVQPQISILTPQLVQA